MKVLHVASFNGNIGDNANHNGLRSLIKDILKCKINYDEMEIRRFYQNYTEDDKLYFDLEFVKKANLYDLVIIGGGNFFEIWIENSSTGCTVDMPDFVIESINTKVLFFGLGFDKYKGYSKKTEKRFLHFIEEVNKYSNYLVTLRNDGSIEQFINSYGNNKAYLVKKVYDGGFFVQINSNQNSPLNSNKTNIILSVAIDMPNVRFRTNEKTDAILDVVEKFSSYIVQIASDNENIHLCLMPHIYSDLEIISRIINELPDRIRRNRISVGPLLYGMGKEKIVFSYYKMADLVIGMRFHANVCAIGLGKKTIGISSYKKIEDLYRDLKNASQIDINDKNFTERLIQLTIKTLAMPYNEYNQFDIDRKKIFMKEILGKFLL